MGYSGLTLIATFAMLATLYAVPTAPPIQAAINRFSNDMYKSLSQHNKGKNIFCSAFSLHAALSMLYQGSNDQVKDALRTSLRVAEPNAVAETYNGAMQHLNSASDITLHIANKIYLKKEYDLNTQFENTLKDKFYSEVESIDFNDGEAAAKTINKWVEDKTNNKIVNFSSKDDFNTYSRLVLLNAIYFKGNWVQSFNKDYTEKQKFHVKEGEDIDVDMMRSLNRLQYRHDDNLKASILELPYKNNEFSMLFVLPDETYGIEDLESKLVETPIRQLKLGEEDYKNLVRIGIPKFKIELKMDLNDVLADLGLSILFADDNHGLRGLLAGGQDLKVSKAIQKTFIEVNEEGAEAAAVTGLYVAIPTSSGSVGPTVYHFEADHPFVFFIVSTKPNEEPLVLFQGKVAKPKYDN